MQISTFREAEAVLQAYWPSNLKGSGKRPYTLDHVQRFMEFAGSPQDKQPAIHIAGTSGKTSTAYYTAALLRAAGKRVGLLTSPHIRTLNERVQIDLEPLPERQFCTELGIFLDVVEQSGVQLAYAELLYAFAFWEFARQRLDYIVVEVGMGGLLDPTNVMTRADKVCVITDIGYDHVQVLGATLPEIAAQKAGIIGRHNAVFCYKQDAVIIDAIQAAARKYHADLHILQPHYTEPAFKKLPAFQRRNSHLALQAVQYVLERDGAPGLQDRQLRQAAGVYIPGRMEVRRWKGKTIIIDGAHNGQKLTTLLASIAERYPARQVAAVVAFAETPGRNAEDQLAPFQHIASHVITTTIPAAALAGMHPSRSAVTLLAAARKYAIDSEVIPDMPQAIQALLARSEAVLVVTGSLYLVAPAATCIDTLTAV